MFAFGSAVSDVTTAHAQAVASGMRLTFAVAAALILLALAVSVASRTGTKPLLSSKETP